MFESASAVYEVVAVAVTYKSKQNSKITKNNFVLGWQKRTSKSKKNLRKNVWKQQISKQATRALYLAKYVLRTKSNQTDISENSVNNSVES